MSVLSVAASRVCQRHSIWRKKALTSFSLRQSRIGFGASGRCGGLVGSGQRKDVLELEESFGAARARELWDYSELAKQDIRDRVAKHAIPCDLQDGQVEGIHKKS